MINLSRWDRQFINYKTRKELTISYLFCSAQLSVTMCNPEAEYIWLSVYMIMYIYCKLKIITSSFILHEVLYRQLLYQCFRWIYNTCVCLCIKHVIVNKVVIYSETWLLTIRLPNTCTFFLTFSYKGNQYKYWADQYWFFLFSFVKWYS